MNITRLDNGVAQAQLDSPTLVIPPYKRGNKIRFIWTDVTTATLQMNGNDIPVTIHENYGEASV